MALVTQSQVPLGRIKRVLNGCRRIENRQRERATTGVVRLMNQMRVAMPLLIKRTQKAEQLNASEFNIFKALRIERRETILHTPLLAFLLNPEESHAQGTLFLKRFIEILGRQKGFVTPRTIDEQTWEISSEVPVGRYGIIDLLIECGAQNYILVVENKIQADEREHQLRDYALWMKRSRRNWTRQIALLTLDGRTPTSNEEFHCFAVSYAKEIRQFLNTVLPKIKAPVVQGAVRQYSAIRS